MAQGYSDVQGVLNKFFQEPLQDYINRANPFLSAIRKVPVASDQIYIKGTLSSSHAAGFINAGADVTHAGTEKTTYMNGTLPFTTIIGKWAVSKLAMEQVRNQPGALATLTQTEIMNAGKDLVDNLAAATFGATNGQGFAGLQSMIATANTYAGIDRTDADFANFRGNVLDIQSGAASAELGTRVFDRADKAFFDNVGYGLKDRPGAFTMFTTSALLDKYAALLQTINLGDLANSHFVNQANATGNLGNTAYSYAGIPIIRDRNVSDGAGDLANSDRIYILDMSKIMIAVKDSAHPELAQMQQLRGFMAGVDGLEGALKPTIEVLGNTGETVRGYVKCYLNLATLNPKEAGIAIINVKNN